MSSRILVLGSRSSKKNDSAVMCSSLKEQGLDVVQGDYRDLEFIIGPQTSVYISGQDLNTFEAVLMLGWYRNDEGVYLKDIAFTAALYAQSHGVSVMNSEVLQQRSTTKLSAMMQLSLGGVDVPQTWFCVNKEWTAQVVVGAPDRYIYKALAASRGNHNYLIDKPIDIAEQGAEVSCMMLQEYIPNDHDLRIVCSGGEPVYIIKRKASGDSHLNNASLSGVTEVLSLEETGSIAIDIARKCVMITSRELGGVDLLFSSERNTYVCLEVNPMPQLTSGVNVEEKLSAVSAQLASKIMKGNT